MILTNSRHERFVQGILSGATATAAYTAAGYAGTGAAQSAQGLLKTAGIQARKAGLEEKVVVKLAAGQIADRQYRLTVIQDVVDRLRMLIDERAAAGRAHKDAAPGADTGLLVRTQKNLRDGKKTKIVDQWTYDSAVIGDLEATLKQAAIEAGEWQERVPSGGCRKPKARVVFQELWPSPGSRDQFKSLHPKERANLFGSPVKVLAESSSLYKCWL